MIRDLTETIVNREGYVCILCDERCRNGIYWHGGRFLCGDCIVYLDNKWRTEVKTTSKLPVEFISEYMM